ncbi:unannotated protein [freshwater metagenome]|uniref:Unannotated protein n=1 Tax=freshwater metagenome TaxID=449393 RepID=A0A6J7LX93_9ZZZZ
MIAITSGSPTIELKKNVRRAPSAMSSPWAKFVSLVVPKTRLSPTAARAITIPKMIPSTVSCGIWLHLDAASDPGTGAEPSPRGKRIVFI